MVVVLICSNSVNFVLVPLGLLTSESTATKASSILQEMINHHIDVEALSSFKEMLEDENKVEPKESRIVKSLCHALLKVVSTHKGIPNEHILAVISVLFIKLGMSSYYLVLIVLY